MHTSDDFPTEAEREVAATEPQRRVEVSDPSLGFSKKEEPRKRRKFRRQPKPVITLAQAKKMTVLQTAFRTRETTASDRIIGRVFFAGIAAAATALVLYVKSPEDKLRTNNENLRLEIETKGDWVNGRPMPEYLEGIGAFGINADDINSPNDIYCDANGRRIFFRLGTKEPKPEVSVEVPATATCPSEGMDSRPVVNESPAGVELGLSSIVVK